MKITGKQYWQLAIDDTCVPYIHQNVEYIEKNLNSDFSNICEWLIDKNVSVQFGEDKTKNILFKKENTSNLPLNITLNENVRK